MRIVNRLFVPLVASALAAYAQSASALSIDLKFGSPSIGALQSTSLADILMGNAEELFAGHNFAYAALTTPIGTGSVTKVGPVESGGQFCTDSCRRIFGDLFTRGGTRLGSYEMTWFYNSSLEDDADSALASASNALRYVEMNAGASAFLATYSPFSQYTNKYGAVVKRKDLNGNPVFTALFESSDCAEKGRTCSAFEIRNDFGLESSSPVDMLSMHFEGRILSVPEPATMALIGVGIAGVVMSRRRKYPEKRESHRVRA